MKRLSKWFYLGSMIGGQVGGIVLLIAAVVLLVASGIPFVNYLVGLPFLAIFIITANKTIDAVNSLLALQAGTIN